MDEGDILFDRMPDYTGGKKAAPAATSNRARVSPEDQKGRDEERRAILESELEKNIRWFEENNRKPTPAGQKEGEEFKARLARAQSDIESLKRELGRMGPAPEALPAADVAEPSLGEGDVKLNEIPVYEDVAKTPNVNANMGVSPELTAGAAGAAGALYGAAKKPTYSQTFADLARDVYGVPSEAVESYLMKKYPQPATAAQLAKDTAQELVERAAAARAASAQTAAANMGDLAVDEHGTVRWAKPRVSPKIGIPAALTDKIVGLTGNAGVPGSAENILAENSERVRKLQAMGHDVANMPKSGELLLAENYRTRGSPLRPATPPAPVPSAASVAPTMAAAPAAGGSYLDDLAKRIQKAGGLAEVLSRGAKAGLYGGATAMSGLDLWHAINSMTQEGVNPQNALQGAEGAGLLGSLANPRMGLGVAGAAKMARAGENMLARPIAGAGQGTRGVDMGITPANAATMASGFGIAAMPYGRPGAVVGALAQVPELTLAAKEWLLAHPEFGQQLQKGSQTWGQSRFGLD